jgi:hypothetical protein
MKISLQAREDTKNLDKQNAEWDENVRNANQATQKLEEVQETYKELFKQFKKTLEKVKSYKKYKAECTALKERLKCYEEQKGEN